MSRRRAKVGEIDYMQLGILAAVAIGGYYLYKKISATLPPITTGGAAQAQATQAAADLAAAIAAGNSLSYPTTQYQQWADAIFQAGSAWGTWASDSASVLNIMTQINNDADFLALVQAWGTRSIYNGLFAITTTPVTLDAFVTTAFSASAIASFNQQLGWNGVTLTF